MDIVTYAMAHSSRSGEGGVSQDEMEKYVKSMIPENTMSLDQVQGWSEDLPAASKTIVIRNAIQEAKDNGFNSLVLPQDAEIEIELNSSTGTTATDGGIGFELPDNFTLDLNGSTIRLVSNEFTSRKYIMFLIAKSNSVICNGTIVGDYSSPNSKNQWGHLLTINGNNNFCYNLTLKDALGDGIYVSEDTSNWGMIDLRSTEGTIDSPQKNLITTSTIDLTRFKQYKYLRVLFKNTSLPSFLNSIIIKVMSDNSDTATVLNSFAVELGDTISLEEIFSKSNFIKISFRVNDATNIDKTFSAANFFYLRGSNIDSGYNMFYNIKLQHIGRNGITVGRTSHNHFFKIKIEDVRGTAPMACVDFEEGRNSCNYNVFEDFEFKNANYGICATSGSHNSFYNGDISNCDIAIQITGSINSTVSNCVCAGEIRESKTNIDGVLNIFDNCTFYNRCVFWNTNVINSRFYNSFIYSDKTGKIKDCRLEGDLGLCGIFEGCVFTHLQTTDQSFAIIKNYSYIPEEDHLLSFKDCKFKGQRLYFNNDGVYCEFIKDCDFDIKRLTNIYSKEIESCKFHGMELKWQLPGITSYTWYPVNFWFIKMSNCHFERGAEFLIESPFNIYNRGLIFIDDHSSVFPVTEMIIEGCKFVSCAKGTDKVHDAALTLKTLTWKLYFFNNIKLNTNAVPCDIYRYPADKVLDTVDLTNLQLGTNYGFEEVATE